MVVFRCCLLASLLAWAGAASTFRQLSASNAASRLLLQVQNVTKNDVARIEAVVSDTVVAAANEATRFRKQRLRRHGEFDTSWQNNLVIIPCVFVGSYLAYFWYKIDSVGKSDEIFTAVDADLREVEIARVGASGVALLRRQEDRHTGIMFAFTGIMLQTIFLYFIAVYCWGKIRRGWVDTGAPTPIALIFCSLFCNTMTTSSSFILGLKCWATKAPEGYQKLHEALVLVDSFCIPAICTVVGALYLCTSDGITNLVFSSTAMAFLCSINMQIAGLMSWSLSGHGGRAFQPANVSIKDSENSTTYAHYSFGASLVVALVTLPVGWLLGLI